MIQLVKGAYKKTNQPLICYVIVRPRFRHLGQFYDAPTIEVLHFIRSVELTKG
jgi:hypothetical protein